MKWIATAICWYYSMHDKAFPDPASYRFLVKRRVSRCAALRERIKDRAPDHAWLIIGAASHARLARRCLYILSGVAPQNIEGDRFA